MPALLGDVPALSAAAGASESGKAEKLAWLDVLVRTKFWKPCEAHKGAARAERCMFCLDCYEVTCPHCQHRDDNPGHRTIKIRRYNLRSVVLAADLKGLPIDVPSIQVYLVSTMHNNYCLVSHLFSVNFAHSS